MFGGGGVSVLKLADRQLYANKWLVSLAPGVFIICIDVAGLLLGSIRTAGRAGIRLCDALRFSKTR